MSMGSPVPTIVRMSWKTLKIGWETVIVMMFVPTIFIARRVRPSI